VSPQTPDLYNDHSDTCLTLGRGQSAETVKAFSVGYTTSTIQHVTSVADKASCIVYYVPFLSATKTDSHAA